MQNERTPQRGNGAWIGALVAVVLVVGGFAYLTARTTHHTTSGAPSAHCAWTPADTANPNLVKTGTPPTSVPASGTRNLTLTTSQGTIVVTLDVADAPCSAASFTYLAGAKYFDNSPCHRMTTSGIFVLQCGDPSGTGSGGPSYTFADENLPTAANNYPAGTVAMANSGPNTNGSQLFLVYKDTPPSTLNSAYSVVGTITSGMDVLRKIAAGGVTAVNGPSDGKPKLPVTITTATVGPIATR